MGEFKSLAEFVKAIKQTSDGEIDSRLIPDNSPEAYFTKEELLLMEQFTIKSPPQKHPHKPTV